VTRGYITKSEASTLISIVNSAMGSNAKKTKLSQFINEVKAQNSKVIATAYANLLVNWATDLQSRQ
jgi:hypothetical protein